MRKYEQKRWQLSVGLSEHCKDSKTQDYNKDFYKSKEVKSPKLHLLCFVESDLVDDKQGSGAHISFQLNWSRCLTWKGGTDSLIFFVEFNVSTMLMMMMVEVFI